MTPPDALRIDAVVDAVERPAFVAAAEQLAECLAAAGAPWHVAVRFLGTLAAVDPADPPHAIVASLLPELARGDESATATADRWRAQLAPLTAEGIAPVFLCTIFRRVIEPGPRPRADVAPSTIERIRRLNLLAINLSHDTGAGVIDIDRIFAHVGVPQLAIDYRLAGPVAAEMAGYAVVAALLAIGLDDVVAPEIQESAQRFQGSPWQLDKFVRRRLARGR